MKTLLTILTFIFALQASAQTDYYIVPADSVADWTPLMIQSLGHSNINVRCNLAADTCLMKFTLALAPAAAGIPYTPEQLRAILNTATWTTDTPDPIESAERIDLARARGEQLTQAFFSRIDENEYDGTWTLGQAANAYINYSDLFGLIREGNFRIAYQLINNGTVAPQGVITQAMLDALKAKLGQWENDHPRP